MTIPPGTSLSSRAHVEAPSLICHQRRWLVVTGFTRQLLALGRQMPVCVSHHRTTRTLFTRKSMQWTYFANRSDRWVHRAMRTAPAPPNGETDERAVPVAVTASTCRAGTIRCSSSSARCDSGNAPDPGPTRAHILFARRQPRRRERAMHSNRATPSRRATELLATYHDRRRAGDSQTSAPR